MKKLPLFFAALLLFVLILAIIIDNKCTKKAVSVANHNLPASVLVIDPGHGGLDGGAVSVTGRPESEYNLAIALKVEDLSRLFGRVPVMTRRSEQLDYPEQNASIHDKKVWDQKQRIAQINQTSNAILLSIHQNKYPDARPSGTQVLYGSADGSMEFGTLVHENLIRCLCPENRRVAVPVSDKIYLMKNVICPAILVECGFLSNREEAGKLDSDDYRTAIAAVLYASYLQYTGN